MPVRAACPNPECRRSYTLADGLATKSARCPGCRTVLTYPDTADSQNETIAVPAAAPPPEPLSLSDAPTETGPTPPRVGRFVVLGKLGSGAFGTVYKARDPQLERDVALKVPNPGMLDTPKRVERFLREAKAAARLRHPHIVPVFDAGKDGDRYYIASAFIDGKPLSDVLDDGMDFRRAAEVVRLLAEAVGYAHEQGVVHRDIKPHNVMLDAADRPHLMDFGLAVRADEAEKLTSDGAVMGTPAYMAPEQAAGQKGDASPLSDQYSLGVLLYELLTGQTPFSGLPAAVIYRVIHHDPPAPRTARPDIPPDLETVCLKAMAKRPTDRYPMCRMLADDLRLWLAGEPITARRQTAAEKAVRWVRRNRAVAALMLVTFLSLMSGATVATVFGLQARTRARDAEVARDEAQEAERRAEEALRASEASEKKASAALDALGGEQGKGKDLAERISEFDKQLRTRTAEVDRLQKFGAELQQKFAAIEDGPPPPREVDLERRRELNDLRAELADTTARLAKATVRGAPSRPQFYQQVLHLHEDGPKGAGESAAAALGFVPDVQRGWEWNYLTNWQRPRTYPGRTLHANTKSPPLDLRLSARGDKAYAIVYDGPNRKGGGVLYEANLSGPTAKITSRQPRVESPNVVMSCLIVGSGKDTPRVIYSYKNAIVRGQGEVPYQLFEGEFINQKREPRLVTDLVVSPGGDRVAYRVIDFETGKTNRGISLSEIGRSYRAAPPDAGPPVLYHGFDDLPPERRVVAVADDGDFLALDSGTVLALPSAQARRASHAVPLAKAFLDDLKAGKVKMDEAAERKKKDAEAILAKADEEGKPVAKFSFPGTDRPVVFSPKSAWLATVATLQAGTLVEKVVFTSVRRPADPERVFVGHTGLVRAVAFSADESRLITGGDDGTVRVWDTETAECLLTLKAGGTPIQIVTDAGAGQKFGKRITAIVEDSKDSKLFHARVWEVREPSAKK